MKRRQLLGSLTLGAITAPINLSWAQGMAHAPNSAGSTAVLLDSALLPGGTALGEIPRLANASTQPGTFKATLTAAPLAVPLIPGRPATEFWVYNRRLPGPLIELTEGDQVEITFVNQLPQPSTIHWHGLAVPPEQDGNPWDLVQPGGSRTYRFTAPAGSAGTYWYHPHPHAHTAEQASRGLAGPLIVRARKDPLAAIRERLLVISDLKLDSNAVISANDGNDEMNGREGQFALVNAQQQPVVPFDASGRERWRVWNACSARYLLLTLPGSTLTLVGTDGGLIERPQGGLKEYLLAPGQRAELVVDAGTRRDHAELIAARYNRGKMGPVAPEKAIKLLTVNFAAVGPTLPVALPVQLGRVADLGATKSRKQVVFSESMSMAGGRHSMKFLVNGKEFDMKRVDLVSRRGEVELWDLVNRSDMDHPFHLHGTQFQVVSSEFAGKVTPAPFRANRDTVNLRSGETVRIKTVQNALGLRMFHCHILEHEAAGMMGQLKVV